MGKEKLVFGFSGKISNSNNDCASLPLVCQKRWLFVEEEIPPLKAAVSLKEKKEKIFPRRRGEESFWSCYDSVGRRRHMGFWLIPRSLEVGIPSSLVSNRGGER